MYEFLIWFFGLISEFISTSMTWKIYGDFSLTHILLGSLFLIALFGLFGFSIPYVGDEIDFGARSYKNSENKKEREQFKKERTQYTYLYNPKTGEFKKRT